MQVKLSALWRKHGAWIIACVAVAAFYAVLFAFGITCPIKHVLGISCAGCGMTRACMSALRLDFAAAFSYHPLWIVLPFGVPLGIYFKVKHHKAALYTLLSVFAAMMLAVYFYRLLTGSDIVQFAPETGWLFKMLRF